MDAAPYIMTLLERHGLALLAYTVSLAALISWMRFKTEEHSREITEIKREHARVAATITVVQNNAERLTAVIEGIERRTSLVEQDIRKARA
jgi:hypothetical protein